MKTHLMNSSRLLGALLLGLGAGTAAHAQLSPLNCGAVSTNAGAKLSFVNGASFSSDSGFVQPLTYQRVANRFGTNVYYSATNLLFTPLSVKTNPATSAAFGSYLVCEVVAVSGPPGGVLSFWEQGAGWATYSFPEGQTPVAGKNRFILSNCENGAGRPDGDPFGSVRGRRFVVNKAGDYLVTFRLVDVSGNHPTLVNTPVHAPSDPLTIKFTTGVDIGITRLAVTNDVATLVFKQGQLTNMVVEATTNLASPTWVQISSTFTSAPISLTTNLFTNTPGTPAMLYRLRAVSPP